MNSLYIPGVNAPAEIKQALQDLSKNILFTREDAKAANGYVFFGVNRITDIQVAVKFYYWGGKPEHHAEPKQLSQIEAENVLKIYDAALLDGKWAYFITPYCQNGDIDRLLETTSLGNLAALDYTHQILAGLSHLHSKRFLHRDIKPANIYLTDTMAAVIGDFGSVKKIPEGSTAIPASSHSLLYRPPESITTNSFGIAGDLYQAGLVLYQLLGGSLPYDGIAWLDRRQVRHFESLSVENDQRDFVDQCIRARIVSGRVVDLATLPPWVPKQLHRVIRKACHIDQGQRFQNASSFMAKLYDIRPAVPDWQVVEGLPTLVGSPSYRIIADGSAIRVQKRISTSWRNDNSFQGSSLDELVSKINGAV